MTSLNYSIDHQLDGVHVVLASSAFYGSGGGIASYNRSLADLLISSGARVTLCLPDHDVQQAKDPKLPVLPFSTRLFGVDEVKQTRDLLKKIQDCDPDVLLSSDNIYVNGLFPAFQNSTTRTVSIVHFNKGVIAKAAVACWKACDSIVVLSAASRDAILSLGVSPERVRVAYNFDTEKHMVPEAKQPRIVYPGGQSAHKAPERSLKLACQLRSEGCDWPILWLGRSERFQAKARKKCGQNITFTGALTHEEASHAIASSAIFVLLSHAEGCPMSLIEAMRSGSVPLVSDCESAMREVVEDGVSGFVIERGNARVAAARIIELVGDVKLREDMSRAAILRAREVFNPRRYITMIRDILDHAKAPGAAVQQPCSFTWHRTRIPGRPSIIESIRFRVGRPNLKQQDL